MKSSYLGPEFGNKIIQNYLDKYKIKYHKLDNSLLTTQGFRISKKWENHWMVSR